MVDGKGVSFRSSARDSRDGSEYFSDVPVLRWLARRIPPRLRQSGPRVAVGRAVVLLLVALLACSAPFLGLSVDEWRVVVVVSLVLVLLVTVSIWFPWERWSPEASLAFPLTVLAALVVIGRATEGVAVAYVGVVPLVFVYLGVFLRPGSAVLTVPLAWVAYVSLVDHITVNTVVRLLISGATWLTISGVLSVLISHERHVRYGLRLATRVDALTSLGNRRGLDERLATLVPGDCVVLCDLDLFKGVNDAFGHAAGDEVLAQFGELISQQLRRRDYAARYGGEEFVLVLARTNPAQALAALAALRTEWLDLAAGVTFSAGVAAVTGDQPGAAVLAAADAAMYEAKAAGRDEFRVAPTFRAA